MTQAEALAFGDQLERRMASRWGRHVDPQYARLASFLRSLPSQQEQRVSPKEAWPMTRLRSALENYGRHHPWCASWQSNAQKYEECNCGLAESLKIGRDPFYMSKEWCMAAAEREGNSEVGAGMLPEPPPPVPEEIGKLISNYGITVGAMYLHPSSDRCLDDSRAARAALESAIQRLKGPTEPSDTI